MHLEWNLFCILCLWKATKLWGVCHCENYGMKKRSCKRMCKNALAGEDAFVDTDWDGVVSRNCAFLILVHLASVYHVCASKHNFSVCLKLKLTHYDAILLYVNVLCSMCIPRWLRSNCFVIFGVVFTHFSEAIEEMFAWLVTRWLFL